MQIWFLNLSRMHQNHSYQFDLLPSVNEGDSTGFYEATGSTSSRVPAGSCCRPLLRFATQAIPACPAVSMFMAALHQHAAHIHIANIRIQIVISCFLWLYAHNMNTSGRNIENPPPQGFLPAGKACNQAGA